MIEIFLALVISGNLPIDAIDFSRVDAEPQELVLCSSIAESGRSLCLRGTVSVLGDDSILRPFTRAALVD